jgi:hypothetical protein
MAGVLRLYIMTPLGWRWLRQDVGVNPVLLVAVALPSLAASIVMALLVVTAKVELAPLLQPAMLAFSLVIIGVVGYGILSLFTARALLAQVVTSNVRPNAGLNRRITERLIGFLTRVGYLRNEA